MGSAKSLLLLGSNLGNKEESLISARKLISENSSCEILKVSSIYETEPWGIKSKNSYLNQAILLNTSLNPFELLEYLLETEFALGRVRNEQWEDRVIDIDILLFNDFILDSSELKIPHPQMESGSSNAPDPVLYSGR